MNVNQESHTLNSNPIQRPAADSLDSDQPSKSGKGKHQSGITTNTSNTMTSSGLSGVATAASGGGAKRPKEDKNVSGQTTIAIKDGEK